MLTKETEAAIRAKIDPHMKGMRGTYSHELDTLLGEINRLRDEITKRNSLLNRAIACSNTLADAIKDKQS